MNKFMIHEFNFIKNATSREDVAQTTIAPKLYRKPKNSSSTIVKWVLGMTIFEILFIWFLWWFCTGTVWL